MSFTFHCPDRRAEWEETFLKAKQMLGEKNEFCSPAPENAKTKPEEERKLYCQNAKKMLKC